MFRRNVPHPPSGSSFMVVYEALELVNRSVSKLQLLSLFLSQRPVSDLTAYLIN